MKEYGHEYQRSGNDGGSNSVHGACGCLVRRAFAFIEFRLYGFDYDDRIIDYRTDNQNQCEECQQVEAESGQIKESKCSDQ